MLREAAKDKVITVIYEIFLRVDGLGDDKDVSRLSPVSSPDESDISKLEGCSYYRVISVIRL